MRNPVSINFNRCKTREEKIDKVFKEEVKGILETLEVCRSSISKVIDAIKTQLDKGNKIIVTGAGASALVAQEMAGQGMETGLPILVFTNSLAEAFPVSFSKGVGEGEGGLSHYTNLVVDKGDVVIGISASGRTGFVYETLKRARKKGAVTIAITENVDTPLTKNADYVLKSNAKPEGPSSSKIQVAHLAIAHTLMLILADERGITADDATKYMSPELVPTKKMGTK